MKKFSFLLIIMTFLSGCSNQFEGGNTDDMASATIRVSVDEETSLEKTVYFTEGDPLLEVMREYFVIETEETAYGEHIIAIDDFDTRETENGAYWIYEINHTLSSVSEADYALQEDDFVEWKFWLMTVED